MIEKVELQNAADATADSAARWLARGLNAITATNHIIGEGMSLVVIHEAVAGEKIEASDLTSAERNRARLFGWILRFLRPLARRVGGWTISYDQISRTVDAGATVGQGEIRLKEALAVLYVAQIIAGSYPPTRWIVYILNLVELDLRAEWMALDALEKLAKASKAGAGVPVRPPPARREAVRG